MEKVELPVHKESVVVEEIKEVELRSRHVQFIYDRNYNRIGLQTRGHAPSRFPGKKVRRLLHKRKKVKSKGICMEGYPEKYRFLLFSALTINQQPRRRSARSHSVLFGMNLGCLWTVT